MNWPPPRPGQVIRYSYLWREEANNGREEGGKDRPCAVVVVVKDKAGRPIVYVLPVTHSPPINAETAIELPAETKLRLGLDDRKSWIIISESNEFAWPGPDIRPRVTGDLSTVIYGALAPNFFKAVRDRFLAYDATFRGGSVKRTE